MSFSLFKYVLKAALRDRLMLAVLAVSVIGICLSIFSGSVAIIEKEQFVLAYMAGGLRIISIFGLSLFTIFFTRRSFDARDIEFLLTRPVSRFSFVLSFATGLLTLAIMTGLLLSVVIGGAAFHAGNLDGILVWCLGVTFEFMIMILVAFFFSMVLSTPVTAGLSTFGFYVLARMMGQLMAISHSANSIDEIPGLLMKVLSWSMDVVAIVIPRLDLMTQTSWLIYGGVQFSDWVFVAVQGIVFIALILLATFIDLRRRQF